MMVMVILSFCGRPVWFTVDDVDRVFLSSRQKWIPKTSPKFGHLPWANFKDVKDLPERTFAAIVSAVSCCKFQQDTVSIPSDRFQDIPVDIDGAQPILVLVSPLILILQ